MNWLKSLANLIWTGWGGQDFPRNRFGLAGALNGLLPGSDRDFEVEAGPPWMNGSVAACLRWLIDEFPQALFVVRELLPDGTQQPLWTHRLPRLLAKPNPFHTEAQLWQATLVDYVVHGDAYWLILESAAGDPVEVWPISPDQIEPQWPLDGSQWISHYVYTPNGTPFPLPTSRVIHFRDGRDPSNPRKGLGRVQPVLREIAGDNEAATYTYALLKNLGQSGVVLSLDTAGLSDDQARRLVSQLEAATTRDARFRTLALTVPVKTSNTGLTPEQMRLDVIPKHLEARICAAIGISPMVLGLPAAKDFATYANADAAERGAWSRIRAIQRNMAGTIQRDLLPLLDSRPSLSCGWDWSQVAALQPDALVVAQRSTLLFKNQITTRKESREIVGLEPLGNPALDDALSTSSPAPPAQPDAASAPSDPLAATGRGSRFPATFPDPDDDQWSY
jgi:HK97 family phage portal protein